MGKLFGTDGVRGVYGKELTDDLARKLGYFGTLTLTENHKPRIIIGTDTRESAKPLEEALIKGITQAGGEVLLAGVVPTPAVAVLVKELNADAGIVISASHNPFEFNGIKFFNNEGYKLLDAVEDSIEEQIFNTKFEPKEIKDKNIKIIENAEDIYLNFINKDKHNSLKGKKIVLDCSNGALFKIAPDYFKSLGADIIVIGNEPNGKNINLNCGSTHLESIQEKVKESGADFGFAFDGDADRCLAIDENGDIIDGDKILNLIARKLKKEGKLKDNMVVVTEMSNYGLPLALQEDDIKCIRTDVGDRYVLEQMLENNYSLGGEQSGHIIILDKNTTGDGLLTASVLADILTDSNQKPSELSNLMKVYPQVLKNATVENNKKESYKEDPVILEKINELNKILKDSGRVFIRTSGTEPLVRVMLEGNDQDLIEKLALETTELIEKRLS